MLTVASNTSAFPRIVNGLETSSPGRGLVTTMAGCGVGDAEVVGDAEPVAVGLGAPWELEEHAASTAEKMNSAIGELSLLPLPFRRTPG